MKPTQHEHLESVKPRSLTSQERERAWQAIESRIVQMPFEPSPKIINFKPMPFAPIILSVLLIVGASAAAAITADTAIPGDPLYTLDRSIEEFRLRIAVSANAKARLHAKFSEERLDEAQQAVIEEETAVNTSVTTAAELKSRNAARAQLALQTAIETLTDVRAKLEVRDNAEASARIETVWQKLIDLNEQHLRLLQEIEAKIDTNETDDGAGNQNLNLNGNANLNLNANINTNILNRVIEEIEADISGSAATDVRIKYNDGETRTTVGATTRADIVAELSDELDVPAAEVDALLELKTQ